MSPITTHVLDTMTGKPAEALHITLEEKKSGEWHRLASGKTDSDGRIKDLLKPGSLKPGIYRMHFDTDGYLEKKGITGFYPEAVICFRIDNVEQHYHIPLLLSPFGYSTYRGS